MRISLDFVYEGGVSPPLIARFSGRNDSAGHFTDSSNQCLLRRRLPTTVMPVQIDQFLIRTKSANDKHGPTHKNTGRQSMLRYAMLIVVTIFANTALADPLFQTLPEDGVGVKFHVNMVLNGAEQIRSWQILSVGKHTKSSKPARWIELHGEAFDGTPVKYKLLVPESEFGRGKNPLGKATEAWRKIRDQTPEKIEDFKTADVFLNTLLSGPGKDVRKLDTKKQIGWQKGNFDCEVVEGSARLSLGIFNLTVNHRCFYNETAPFGFVGTEQEFEVTVNGKTDHARIEALIVDILKKQKTAFPEVR